jgi:hypothetical protein
MQQNSRAQVHKHLIVRTASGARTSVSIPELDVDLYVTACYGNYKLFRRHLNAAVLETTSKKGLSFSEAVRTNLDRRMAQIVAGR